MYLLFYYRSWIRVVLPPLGANIRGIRALGYPLIYGSKYGYTTKIVVYGRIKGASPFVFPLKSDKSLKNNYRSWIRVVLPPLRRHFMFRPCRYDNKKRNNRYINKDVRRGTHTKYTQRYFVGVPRLTALLILINVPTFLLS